MAGLNMALELSLICIIQSIDLVCKFQLVTDLKKAYLCLACYFCLV